MGEYSRALILLVKMISELLSTLPFLEGLGFFVYIGGSDMCSNVCLYVTNQFH